MRHFFFVFLSIIYCTNLASQNFQEEDKEGFRNMLRQSSSLSGKSNLECVGLTATDTLSWKTSEAWIEVLQNKAGQVYIDWEWSANIPSRLLRLEVKSFTEAYRLSGMFDGAYFQELETLNLDSCAFSALNLLNNPALKQLSCAGNDLSSIDLSRNVNLQQLNCATNNLTELNLAYNTNLGVLNCANNRLSTVDLSKQVNLVSLYCAGNNLTSLNLTANPNLETLDCSDNSITGIDLTSNNKLAFLSCSGNPLNTVMDMTGKTGLKSLYVANAQQQNVDVSGNRELILLYSPGNDLESLNVAVNSELRVLVCSENDLTNLDLSANLNLDWLDCSDNQLQKLQVGQGLSTLYFVNNQLKFSAMQVGDPAEYSEIVGLTQLIDGGSIQQGSTIELNSEYEIYGNTTNYEWYDDMNAPIMLMEMSNGDFYADPLYLNQTLTCRMTNASFPGTTVDYSVTIDTVTGSEIQEQGVKNQLVVYPNPVKDVLYIKALNPVKSVELYDATGRLMKKEAQENTQYEIGVNDMPQGLYILRATDLSGKVLTTKIEKK
jgi:hypothetical protein